MTPERNPWKKLGSRVVYETPWMTIHEDRVVQPDGREGTYSYMETRVATGVVALTPDREVYLVGQYRYPMDAYAWEIIEGGGEAGEDPLETAMRELREEAGLIARDWRPLGGELHLNNLLTTERGYLFLAQDLTDVEVEPDANEKLQLRKIPLAEAIQLVDDGGIQDALSIVALLRTERLVG